MFRLNRLNSLGKPIFRIGYKSKLLNFKTPTQSSLRFLSDEKENSNELKLKHSELKKTAQEEIVSNVGLSKFLNKVYMTTGMGVGSSLLLAQSLHHFDLAMTFAPYLFGCGIISSFSSIYALDKIKYKVKKTSDGIYESENPTTRKLAFYGLTMGMGATLAPCVSMVSQISPTILPLATGLTFLTMGGASLYAYKKPSGDLLKYQAPLMGGLFGLIGISLTGVGSLLLLGADSTMFQMLHSIDTYGGIVLFTGFTAYDTHVAIDRYKKKDPDHLGCATDFYLNAMNMITRFMEILAKAKTD